MSFSQFKTIAEVQKAYNIRYIEQTFIKAIDAPVPQSLIEEFQFNQEHIDVFASEAARSELIISPLLRAVYKNHSQDYSFWIQKYITFDDVLSGTPDYMFSKRSSLGKTVLDTPIVIIVEAKKNDFEQGWGQCLAELVASQKINNDPENPVYGVVTDGNLWQFGYLCTDLFTKDNQNYTIDKLNALYGALEYLASLVKLS
jgi:hypothetical protein